MKFVLVSNQCRAVVNFWSVLLKELQGAGHEVTCLVPDHDPDAIDTLSALGVHVRHYPLQRKGLNPLRDMKSFFALYREFKVLRAQGYEAAFLTTIKGVIYGLPSAALAGIPNRCAMITGLGYMFEADTPMKKVLRTIAALLYRVSLGFSKVVLFQNNDDLATFKTHGCLPSRARVEMTRGTGVDTTHFMSSPLPALSAPVFLLVARLLEAKGLAEYAEAARLVKESCPAARFQLLGPPETGRGGVPMDTVREWERQGLVEYLGETRDTRPFLEQCTVVVLPSWREGLPCSLMEGMSTRRAVIATDVPGCRDLVCPEKNGLLCPVRDPKALAAACLRFVYDPTLAERLGAAGRHMAEEDLSARKAAKHIMQMMNIPLFGESQ